VRFKNPTNHVLLTHAIEPTGLFMTRRILLGLKVRAKDWARRATATLQRIFVRPHDFAA
jgi:hypothetical protein